MCIKQKKVKKNQTKREKKKKKKRMMNKRFSQLISFIKCGQYFVEEGIRVLIIIILWFVVGCSIVVGY